MQTKLIMVEGIPGSGKSTVARKIADYYKNKNVAVQLFNEGQAHPADLAWSAYVPLRFLDGLLAKHSGLESEIRKNLRIEGDYALIAYTSVRTDNPEFYKDFEAYEVYDGRVPFDVFKDVLYSRWQSFGKRAMEQDELNIFECAFLQNNVNDLLGFRLSDRTEIEEHLLRLISFVEGLSPVLIYLSQPSVSETIARVAEERTFAYGKWIDRVVDYTENMPYGKRHNLKGFAGAIQFFEDRKLIELDIIKTLPIQAAAVENKNYDWDGVWEEIECFLRIL